MLYACRSRDEEARRLPYLDAPALRSFRRELPFFYADLAKVWLCFLPRLSRRRLLRLDPAFLCIRLGIGWEWSGERGTLMRCLDVMCEVSFWFSAVIREDCVGAIL